MTPQPLPPALTRLAAALELSSGFTLFFITGPRDHENSVYLRLHALAGDHELVRHYLLGRHRIDLIDTLAAGSDERPRVVFVSGLESMATDIRREVIERLNLLRDSWAPYPARVVFWLPSWGLAEFRRIAPDLFDWRSGLVTLNDADLPIRDEHEYLVWASERHKGTRSLIAPPRQWASLRQWMDQLPNPAVVADLDPAERHRMARVIVSIFATDTRYNGTRGTDSRDRPQRKFPVPVLVRAPDAAGKLDPKMPWLALARAAGIPGPDTAADVLAAVAAEQRLLILLDGFDQLGLDDGSAARLWLEHFLAHDPPIWMIATTSAAPSAGFFAPWPRAPTENRGSLTDTDELARPHLDLVHLIQTLFPTSDDLTTLATYILGVEADELPSDAPPEHLATRLVLACARRGLLDAFFFAELTRMRPAHAPEIATIARALTDE